MNSANRLLDRLPHTVTDRLPGRLGERSERSAVAVVRLHGVITPSTSSVARQVINLTTVEPVLKRAFAADHLAAVAIVINSPGGAATQSALVADRIRGLAAEHDIPVLAFCEDVAASGGYWLACAADEIYAHPTSLVGSIGVVSGGFGMAGLLERLGVERRVYTAGASKSRLDPFLPEKPDDVAWLTDMQDQFHELFQDWVRTRRGDKLVPTDDTDPSELFTGEVWTGVKAKQLGLVDGLGTLREVISSRFPDAEPMLVEGRKPLLARLGMAGVPGARGAGAGVVEELLEVAESRAAWARFGL